MRAAIFLRLTMLQELLPDMVALYWGAASRAALPMLCKVERTGADPSPHTD
jgi:hypothetical protein